VQQSSHLAAQDRPARTLDEDSDDFRRGPHFEELAVARARNQQRIEALADREPDIADALEESAPGSACGWLICATCTAFRRLKS
jgi:hypothetical protein